MANVATLKAFTFVTHEPTLTVEYPNGTRYEFATASAMETELMVNCGFTSKQANELVTTAIKLSTDSPGTFIGFYV